MTNPYGNPETLRKRIERYQAQQTSLTLAIEQLGISHPATPLIQELIKDKQRWEKRNQRHLENALEWEKENL